MPLNCTKCNSAFEKPAGRGRPPKTCPGCRPAAISGLITKLCPECGESFETKDRRGPVRSHCSQRCRKAASYKQNRGDVQPRDCQWCSSSFTPAGVDATGRRMTHGKYCTTECKRLATNRIVRDRDRSRRPDPAERSCACCGRTFYVDPSSAVQRKYCTVVCRRNVGTTLKNHRRRARMRNAFVEDVISADVFKADGWKCHLCGKAVSKKAKAPHPRSPTVDHIVPLAAGGKHERLNCRTACFGCNSSKGARGGGEQLLLLA